MSRLGALRGAPWRLAARGVGALAIGSLAVGFLALCSLVFGCARADAEGHRGALASSPSAERPAPSEQNELVVFAATSLRDAFSRVGQGFEASHPGVRVVFNFAGTQALRTQLEHGAQGDVFASADQRHMAELVRAGRVAEPKVFARNEPVVVVSREAADELAVFADLRRARGIVLGAPEVPIGRYTSEILERASAELGSDFRARVEAQVVSRELNVRQVLHKVSVGEAQAGVVYRTDVGAAEGQLRVVAIPQELNVVAEYPIARVAAADHPELAAAFIDYVFSEVGQRALRDFGFNAPAWSVSSQ